MQLTMQEAYNRALQFHKDEIDRVEELIKSTAEKGKFGIIITPKPKDGVLYKLENMGFRVNHTSLNAVHISWNHGK